MCETICVWRDHSPSERFPLRSSEPVTMRRPPQSLPRYSTIASANRRVGLSSRLAFGLARFPPSVKLSWLWPPLLPEWHWSTLACLRGISMRSFRWVAYRLRQFLARRSSCKGILAALGAGFRPSTSMPPVLGLWSRWISLRKASRRVGIVHLNCGKRASLGRAQPE